jgi:hypothetical protein
MNECLFVSLLLAAHLFVEKDLNPVISQLLEQWLPGLFFSSVRLLSSKYTSKEQMRAQLQSGMNAMLLLKLFMPDLLLMKCVYLHR